MGASSKVLLLLEHDLTPLKPSLVTRVFCPGRKSGANLFNSTIQVAHPGEQLTSYPLALFP
jgi:hypothetical protein